MTVSHLLHQLLLQPLELIFEFIYSISLSCFHSSGLSIFCMSLTMNLLLLPLYRRADAIQDEERAIEKRLEPGVAHIKKTFQGDERFLMFQAYYHKINRKKSGTAAWPWPPPGLPASVVRSPGRCG